MAVNGEDFQMRDNQSHNNTPYDGSVSRGSSNAGRSGVGDNVIPISFLVIAVFMFVTGHYPHIF